MQIYFLCVGGTQNHLLKEIIESYEKKLPDFINFSKEEIIIHSYRNKDIAHNLKLEKEAIMKKISKDDTVFLLDENGKMLSSRDFASLIQNKMMESTKRLVFIVGGAFGFHEEIKQYFSNKISLSKMTFTHQMVRLFFTEQLYRAMSIIQNKSYHHD